MGKEILLAFGILISLSAFSQGPPRAGGDRSQLSIGRFFGRIIDEKTNKGIEAVSIQLVQLKYDTATHNVRTTPVAAMLTKKNGEFSIEGLSLMGKYTLSVSTVGYTPVEQQIQFDVKPGGDFAAASEKDLGNIKLKQDAQQLESVTVTAEKPLMQMGIDRKIFNVDKNITSAGGSAVDIMRNIPALNVDIDGNVTLRNSAPQIFVDGRPTTLTLDQIPADAIESVEMITNPSAKYDASTGQSGILNIVLKKARKTGYNGSVRAGVDSRGKFNGGLDMNVREGKINVFASAFGNQRKSKSFGNTDRLDISTNPNTRTVQDNNSVNNGTFAFGRLGLDYFIDNRNTITISENIASGTFKSNNDNNLLYETVGSSSLESQYRNTLGKNTFRNYTSNIGYKHTFAEKGRELTADLTYNKNPITGNQDIYIRSFNDIGQQDPKSPEQFQNIQNTGNNRFFVAQADYVQPVGETMKWEAGLRSQVRNFSSNQLYFLNGLPQLAQNNLFNYTDYVHAAYATFSQKVKDKFSYQVGLRAESSNYNGEQIGKQTYKNNFPLSLFPSVFLSKSMGHQQDIQLNFSRKINRPGFFQLMPNTDFSDTLNLQTGNPDLRPEFTNSLELSYMKTYGEKNNTFLVTLFGKHTTDLIARYQSLRPIGDTTAFVSSWINASTANAAGVELIFRNTIFNWWELNLNTNVYYSKINGSNVVAGLENERVSSFSKINNTFKLTKTLSIQLSGDYQSKSALPVSTSNSSSGGGGGGGGRGFGGGSPSTSQGYINANYGMDIGIRKEFKIKKNQASLSLNINDVLKTRRYSVHSESVAFIQDEWRKRDQQVVRLNFNYRFGKFDANLFKRKNNRTETDTQSGGDTQ